MRIQISRRFLSVRSAKCGNAVGCRRDAMPGAKGRFADRNLTPVETRATTPRGSAMSHNTFGHLFRVTTFGESHGVALGCVVDGCPPGIALTAADIQPYLDQRRPGQSRFTTQRREPDAVKILSGTFPDASGRDVTTGTPIALLIENVDQRSKDYSEIKDTTGRATPTTRMTLSMGYATTVAGAASRRARPRRASRPVRSLARSCPDDGAWRADPDRPA
jgi:hypothetical protein